MSGCAELLLEDHAHRPIFSPSWPYFGHLVYGQMGSSPQTSSQLNLQPSAAHLKKKYYSEYVCEVRDTLASLDTVFAT
jgi:hypothetical protein